MPRNYNPHRIDPFAPGRKTDRGTKVSYMHVSKNGSTRPKSSIASKNLGIRRGSNTRYKAFLKSLTPVERKIAEEIIDYLHTPRALTRSTLAGSVFAIRLAHLKLKVPVVNPYHNQTHQRLLSKNTVKKMITRLIDAKILENQNKK